MQLPRDPTDEPYLNLAIAVKASFLVTRDGDMLSLMQDDNFKSRYPSLAIIDPPAFLTHVRTAVAKELGYE
jgi:predicted nucleic acid-binding protein